MSSANLEISTDIIPAAIHALRGRLGLTFEGMARLIGCSNSAYFMWETGRRIPSGDWLIKMMRLCPDVESLEKFGLDIPERVSNPEVTTHKLNHATGGRKAVRDGRISPRYLIEKLKE